MRPRATIAIGVFALVTMLATAMATEMATGGRAIEECDAAAAQGDRSSAIAAAHAAAEAYVPGSPYPARGYARLEAMARDAETRGDDETANAAWRAMRAAAIATRAPTSSNEQWRQMAEQGLARVGSSARTAEVHLTEEKLLEALRHDETPTAPTLALLAAATAAMLAGFGRLAWLARDASLLKRARWPYAVALAGLTAYVALSVR
jgi:hypothetical protein